MKNKLVMGIWGDMVSTPPLLWEKEAEKSRKKIETEMDLMSPDHRRAHHCAVRELPRVGKPMAPEFIASELDLPPDRVKVILDDLEKRMTFLVRNEEGCRCLGLPRDGGQDTPSPCLQHG